MYRVRELMIHIDGTDFVTGPLSNVTLSYSQILKTLSSVTNVRVSFKNTKRSRPHETFHTFKKIGLPINDHECTRAVRHKENNESNKLLHKLHEI